jgi:response regulator NasT
MTNRRLRVMLVDEHPERARELEQSLCQSGHHVAARVAPDMALYQRVQEVQPDVIIIDTDSPSRDILEHICCITHQAPRPIVMFTSDKGTGTIRAAVKAGVSAYIVDGISEHRLQPILEAAIARFEEFHAMRRELAQAKLDLAERKIIERAKGVVMKQCHLDEESAYQAMRKMAMDRNVRMAELARGILAAAELLG